VATNSPTVTLERFVRPIASPVAPGRTPPVSHRRSRALRHDGQIGTSAASTGSRFEVRVEPGGIETLLNQHPAVSEAVVVATGRCRPERPNRILEPGAGLPEGERVPTTKVSSPIHGPSAFVMLEALPLSPNGKVDRAALPAPSAREAGERRTGHRRGGAVHR
jgi:hypothetical protein